MRWYSHAFNAPKLALGLLKKAEYKQISQRPSHKLYTWAISLDPRMIQFRLVFMMMLIYGVSKVVNRFGRTRVRLL